jgi:hypothetical protein
MVKVRIESTFRQVEWEAHSRESTTLRLCFVRLREMAFVVSLFKFKRILHFTKKRRQRFVQSSGGYRCSRPGFVLNILHVYCRFQALRQIPSRQRLYDDWSGKER